MFDQCAAVLDEDERRLAAARRIQAAMDELGGLAAGGGRCAPTLETAAILERLRTTAAVEQARSLAALTVVQSGDYARAPDVNPPPEATTPHEVALALHCATGTARTRLASAAALVTELPATLAAASAGHLPWWQVRHLEDETRELPAAARGIVDAQIASLAAAGRLSRFRPVVDRLILAVTPEQSEQEHTDAVDGRAVWPDSQRDGTVSVSAGLTAEDADTFLTALDRLKDTALSVPPAGWPAEGRTADQRRADAFAGLGRAVVYGLDQYGLDQCGLDEYNLDQTAGDPHAAAVAALEAVLDRAARADPDARARPPRRGRRTRRGGEALVAVSVETLLGIGADPGDLAGYGPITAAHARRIALSCDSWRRLLTDPFDGALLDAGRTRYLPSPTLAEHVLLRSNRRCTRPGCTRPAAQLDHALAWQDGGTTAGTNLEALCVGCHTAKHTGWTVVIGSNGAVKVSTRHGFTAITPPHDHRPGDRLPRPAPPPRPTSGPPARTARGGRGAATRRLAALSLIRAVIPDPSPPQPAEQDLGWLSEMRRYLHQPSHRADPRSSRQAPVTLRPEPYDADPPF